jgi:TonB family protein
MRSLILLPLLLAAAPLAAQGGTVPGERRVMVGEEGTTLSIDSLTIVHSGTSRFTVNLVTRFPAPVALPSGDSIDREIDLEEIDCGTPLRVRSLLAQLFLGDRVVDVQTLPGRWTLVPEARAAAIQASCAFLTRSFAAALPVEYGAENADRAPVLLNPAVVLARQAREYPAVLRDAGMATAEVALRFRVTPDGRVERGTIRVLSPAAPEVAEAARRVAAAMRFLPAVIRGVSTAVWVSQPVRFAPPAARATAAPSP